MVFNKKMNKKGALHIALVIPLAIMLWFVLAGTAFSLAGIFKFIFSDKTPLILMALFIMLLMLRKNRGK